MKTAKKFFCLEGIDGCGKSTQLKRLAEFLIGKGFDVLTIREPGGSEISENIRKLLLDIRYKGVMDSRTELLLYNAARAQVIAEKIAPALEQGKIVLADRFAWSTLAYQGYGRQIDPQMVLELSKITCGNYNPDLTIVLDVSLEESRRRQAGDNRVADRLESEAVSFFERVRNGYLKIANEFSDCVSLVDANGDPDTIQDQIRQLILQKLV
ncbi:MAG: dTMP kinase [Fibrobacter sp.]|nr:dTMP kinase [Fibrobacter sp.]